MVDVVRVSGATVTRSREVSSVAGNPSARRNGVVIAFWCEGCGEGIEWTLAQHKGESLIGWRIQDITG